MRALRFLIPLLLFLGIGWFLLKGLDRDPREVPSPLIGKAAPATAVQVLSDPSQNWSPAAMRGQVWLLNVWGSWCAACLVEHPLLLEMAKGPVPIVGLAWKDMPENSKAWLSRNGNPYRITVSDFNGRAAIDWGVYGAPETFLIDKSGIIRVKHIGALNAAILESRFKPEIARWQAQP